VWAVQVTLAKFTVWS